MFKKLEEEDKEDERLLQEGLEEDAEEGIAFNSEERHVTDSTKLSIDKGIDSSENSSSNNNVKSISDNLDQPEVCFNGALAGKSVHVSQTSEESQNQCDPEHCLDKRGESASSGAFLTQNTSNVQPPDPDAGDMGKTSDNTTTCVQQPANTGEISLAPGEICTS